MCRGFNILVNINTAMTHHSMIMCQRQILIFKICFVIVTANMWQKAENKKNNLKLVGRQLAWPLINKYRSIHTDSGLTS